MSVESKELTVEQLRRKVVAAKSLLSRLENQRKEVSRSSRKSITEINSLTERIEKQRDKFRMAVHKWRKSQQ